MEIIYNETLGNSGITYTAFCELNKDVNMNTYGITVRDESTNTEITLKDFTVVREVIIDFTETLIRNIVLPDFVIEVAEDYLIA